MNDPYIFPPSMPIGVRMDMEMFEDDEDDDGLPIALSVSNPVGITAESGHIKIEGHAAVLEGHDTVSSSVTTIFTIEPANVEQFTPVPEESPDILWSPIARLFMSPTQYRSVWLPHVADMNFERSECLRRGDTRGAKWAVLRAHYYSVPRKLLAIPGVFLLWLLRHWWPFN